MAHNVIQHIAQASVQQMSRAEKPLTAMVSSVWPLKKRNMTEKKDTEIKFWPFSKDVGASRVRMNMVPVMVAMMATWHTRKMYRKLYRVVSVSSRL